MVLSIPEGVRSDTEALEGYFGELTVTYFMERFFETMLLNQSMSGIINDEGGNTTIKVGEWHCPIEFVFTEEDRAIRESYWTEQETLGNPESDRIILYINRDFIESTILPSLEKTSEQLNSKKPDVNAFTRMAITKLMLLRVFHGQGVGMNASQDPTSSSYKILSKYKSNSTINKRKTKGK